MALVSWCSYCAFLLVRRQVCVRIPRETRARHPTDTYSVRPAASRGHHRAATRPLSHLTIDRVARMTVTTRGLRAHHQHRRLQLFDDARRETAEEGAVGSQPPMAGYDDR